MPQKYVNFYENLPEAQLRLHSTYVVYDKEPYYVVAIANHKPDGIFRIYLAPLAPKNADGLREQLPSTDNHHPTDPNLGGYLDQWLVEHPGTRIIRKKMDSPLFNKFRPFRLGMCNFGTNVLYLERRPRRQTHQGLTRGMVSESVVSLSPDYQGRQIEFFSQDFHDCVVGEYPAPEECLAKLSDPDIEDNSAAFHRDFALVRGPIDMLFLAYRADVVAILPRGDFQIIKLGRDFYHLKEAVEELNLFQTVLTGL